MKHKKCRILLELNVYKIHSLCGKCFCLFLMYCNSFNIFFERILILDVCILNFSLNPMQPSQSSDVTILGLSVKV